MKSLHFRPMAATELTRDCYKIKRTFPVRGYFDTVPSGTFDPVGINLLTPALGML